MTDDDLRDRIRSAVDSVYRPAPGLVRRCAEAVARDRPGRRIAAALAGGAVSALAIAALVLALVRHEESRQNLGPVANPTPVTSASRLVYALTGANQVVAVDRATMHVRWRSQLAASPTTLLLPGAMLQLSRDLSRLYVIGPTQVLGGTAIYTLDATTGRAAGVITLAAPGGAVYRTLAVHPKTGNLYVVGEDQADLLVTVVDPSRGVVLSTQTTRTLPAARARGDDYPYQAAITADGTRLYYSYGPGDADRSGIDWVGISGARLTPCLPATAGTACLPGPGEGFVLDGDHLIFADSSLSPRIVETGRDGAVVRRTGTGMTGGLRDVVLDRTRGEFIAIGECDSQGGLARITRATGRLQVISTPAPAGNEPGPETACGLRPALLAGGTLVVSRVTGSPSPEQAGTLLFVDSATGKVLGTVALPAEAGDVLAAG